MKCQDFEANIDAFIANTLDESTTENMHQHQMQCSDCVQSTKQHAAYSNLIKQWQEPALSEQTKARLLASIDKGANNTIQNNGWPKPSIYSFATGFAAASLLAVSILIGSQFFEAPQHTDADSFANVESQLSQEITLVVNVSADIPNAELQLNLPAELSVVGQELLSNVTLPVSLKKGKNTIVIPVQLEEFALYSDDVVVDASLVYENNQTHFELDLNPHLNSNPEQLKGNELIKAIPLSPTTKHA